MDDSKIFICSRGYGKTCFSYLTSIRILYKEGRISFIDYIYMFALARIFLFGESEENVLTWMEKELQKGEI